MAKDLCWWPWLAQIGQRRQGLRLSLRSVLFDGEPGLWAGILCRCGTPITDERIS